MIDTSFIAITLCFFVDAVRVSKFERIRDYQGEGAIGERNVCCFARNAGEFGVSNGRRNNVTKGA